METLATGVVSFTRGWATFVTLFARFFCKQMMGDPPPRPCWVLTMSTRCFGFRRCVDGVLLLEEVGMGIWPWSVSLASGSGDGVEMGIR